MPKAKDPIVAVMAYFDTASEETANLALSLIKERIKSRFGGTKKVSKRASGRKRASDADPTAVPPLN